MSANPKLQVSMLLAAKWYAEKGLKIFPVHGIVNGKCTCSDPACGSPGKHPIDSGWQKQATCDVEEVTRLWSRYGKANIGLPTGAINGITVLDFDVRKGGDIAFEDWRQEFDEFAATWIVRTGGGGWHVFFKDAGASNSVDRIAPGVDCRGNGGFVVAAPSLHISGIHYEWEHQSGPGQCELASCPPRLLSLLHKKAAVERPELRKGPIDEHTLGELVDALRFIDPDNYLNWVEVGMALHNTSAGDDSFCLWDSWSQQSPKYQNGECEAKWASFTQLDKGLRIGSIFKRAKDAGWVRIKPEVEPVSAAEIVAEANGEMVKPFPLVRASELTQKPILLDWLLRDFIERGSINFLFGDPAAGKSLFALDWAFCIAAGIPWNGRKVKQADVIILAGEGFHGLGRRLKALELKYSIPCPDNLFISQQPAQLADPLNARWVSESIRDLSANPGLVIIDTLHRNFIGDENSAEDIGQFFNNIDGAFKPLGCAVLVVHHSGHGDKSRARGSSSIRGAVDAEFSVTVDEVNKNIVLACKKAKDFEKTPELRFSIDVIDVGWTDEDGESITSVVVKEDTSESINKGRKISVKDDMILSALRESIDEFGERPSPEIKNRFGGFDGIYGSNKSVVKMDYWRRAAYPRLSVEVSEGKSINEAKRAAFNRLKDKFINSNIIMVYGEFAWLL